MLSSGEVLITILGGGNKKQHYNVHLYDFRCGLQTRPQRNSNLYCRAVNFRSERGLEG